MRTRLMVLAAAALLLTAGCSGGGGGALQPTVAASAPVAAGTTLNGNWLLAGSVPMRGIFPSASGMTVTFDVQQGILTGTAAVQTMCGAAGVGLGYSALLPSALKGTVAADGSFSASTVAFQAEPVLTVSGTAPSTAGGPWTGSYTLTGALPALPPPSTTVAPCVLNESGTIQAVAIGDTTGTYAGSATVSLLSFPGGSPTAVVAPLPGPLTISLQMQQGGTYHAPGRPLDGVQARFALTGSLGIAGLPCFSKGTTSTVRPSEVDGNSIDAAFLMDDGSTVQVEGFLADKAASTLDVQSLTVVGGQCSGNYIFFSPAVLQR